MLVGRIPVKSDKRLVRNVCNNVLFMTSLIKDARHKIAAFTVILLRPKRARNRVKDCCVFMLYLSFLLIVLVICFFATDLI